MDKGAYNNSVYVRLRRPLQTVPFISALYIYFVHPIFLLSSIFTTGLNNFNNTLPDPRTSPNLTNEYFIIIFKIVRLALNTDTLKFQMQKKVINKHDSSTIEII